MANTKGNSTQGRKDSKERYSPERLESLVGFLRRLAEDLERTAAAMRAEGLSNVEVGDAMLRRSYRHIEHFSASVERAIDRRNGETPGSPPRAPW